MVKFSRIRLAAVLAAGILILPAIASAAISPLGVAILAPIQFPPNDFTVALARVSAFWGDHQRVYGLDVGAIGNMTDVEFGGIGISGLFNYNKGMSAIVGLQAAGLTNINVNKATIIGLQVAALLNSNQAESTLVGLQIALANYSPYTHMGGFQLGVYNRALTVSGFQIGLINDADSLHGVQIGLLNFHRKGFFSVSPILNIGF